MSGHILRSAIEGIKRLQQREVYEENLIDFAEYVWPVVEPAIPFIKGWAIEAIADHLQAVTDNHIKRLLINVPPGFTKSLLTDVMWPAWEWGPRNMPTTRYVCASYSNHLTERDNMRCRNIVISDLYKQMWGKRFKISNEQFTKIKFANDQTGWKLATSVGGIGVGERGDRFIIDDPNNTMDMESELVRFTTNMWFTEVVPTRLNNPQESAIVIIQQRLHEDDVSGVALSREMGYTHLCIPMEYVPRLYINGFDESDQISTYIDDDAKSLEEQDIFWVDPRTEDGELAWPERFTQKVCDDYKRDQGPHAWCNPYEAPVLMGDLSLRPIGEVKRGDKVVGFTIGNDQKRARLKPAEVLSISVSQRPVVKMVLSSGEIIRCTPEHKWWTGRNDKTHAPYAPAKVGTTLSRVCPAKLPNFDDPEDIRLAGWLSGFFDGEGSIGLGRKVEGYIGSPMITFTQGTGRNGPMCEKLEFALMKFGFSYGFRDKVKKSTHAIRFYWLKNGVHGRESRTSLYQRFLHIVKPVKWRDRLIESVTNGRLYTGSERVLHIIPDGTETVYGLETTTGNYVVWGLASSNSGQFQQTPEPRGGSIIKRDFWQLWEPDKYPAFEFILASLDTAYTAKEENDPSALTIWGVFRDDAGNPKMMLMYAWQERLEFHDLFQRVIDTCTISPVPKDHPRFPVDRLLIESKASGQSIGQELHRLVRGTGRLGIELIDPKRYGDKVARVQSIQHLFADKMIYAPDKSWADMVINQSAVFPKSAHDDLVDSMSQALRYLRDAGFALRREEQTFETEQDMLYRSPSENLPLYPA